MVKLYVHGQLIDGVSDDSISDGMIAWEGKTILYAGPYSQEAVNRYPGAETEDVSGKTIMPGLIDAHVHLTMYGKGSSVNDFLTDSATYTAIKASQMALRDLRAGFTTIRSLGDKASADFAVKRAVNEGLIEGPRILSSGKCISITGGHGDFVPGDVKLDTIGETCDGVEEVRRAARARLKNNADCIKLMSTGGGNSPGPGTASQMTVEEMRAAVEVAETRNVLTAAHCIGAEGIKNAMRAGVRTIEHASFLDDEGIEMALRGGHYISSTLCAFRTMEQPPEAGIPGYVVEKIRYFATAHYTGLKKAYKAGVKFMLGTDAGTPYNFHGCNAEEIWRFVRDGGFTPMDAIKAGTSVAAEGLRQDDIGVLAAGKTADILIVEGNVLEDVRILCRQENIKVIHNGKLVVK
ncbi:MAG: amidohydrolase family protein [Eubacteriales bacterium]|nr:amidohydrolase family protein [Eubacteriales bacterium]